MARFGQAALVGLGHEPEAGIKSYVAQVVDGTRRDSAFARLRYLADVNYAHNYINWIRKKTNDPAYLARAGRIEKRILQPLHSGKSLTERARHFLDDDYHVEPGMADAGQVRALREDLFAQDVYYDPYVTDFAYRGRPEDARHPMLYMDSQALFENPHFLALCTNADLIAFCREVLGPAAALSWAWSWISNPGFGDYQNQNWHRDSSEPLNFIRVFVPLNRITNEYDGPTVLIPRTSKHPDFWDVRRYSDQELSVLQAQNGAGMIMAEEGDVYFVNTFALHRGTAPLRRRAILTLLVSLSPSHRTPSIRRLSMDQVPADLRGAVAANRRFFRYLID